MSTARETISWLYFVALIFLLFSPLHLRNRSRSGYLLLVYFLKQIGKTLALISFAICRWCDICIFNVRNKDVVVVVKKKKQL